MKPGKGNLMNDRLLEKGRPRVGMNVQELGGNKFADIECQVGA